MQTEVIEGFVAHNSRKKKVKKKKFTTFQELYADPVITSLKKGKALNP